MAKQIIGSVETGGTKTKCAIALAEQNLLEKPKILDQTEFPTTTPGHTMAQIITYFEKKQLAVTQSLTAKRHNVHEISAIGVACFGPIDPNPASETYGYITTTPKEHWQDFNFIGELKSHFSTTSMAWDTDVNAPALAEGLWGCAIGLDPVVYITVGTGLGGGAIVNGAPLHGLMHPEMGHILVRSHEEDSFRGSCPYHECCLEGMASGTAIAERWGQKAQELPSDHIAWHMEAYYLAQGLQSFILTLSPQKIIIGGGVMQQVQLFDKLRRELQKLLNSYVKVPQLLDETALANFICAPAFGNDAGLYGGFALALKA